MENQKILITGGTGFVGKNVVNMLLKDGHYVTIVTRSPEKYTERQAKNRSYVGWNDDLVEIISQQDVVINLVGENLFGQRWTEEVKKNIYNSRIENTRKLVEAMIASDTRPELFISASAVGIYGDNGDKKLTETNKPGDDFLANVCKDWEKESQRAAEYGVRVVNPRIGIVLGKEGGILSKMVPAFKFFVGGPVGSGDQYIPWIHIDDLCRAILYPLENDQFKGAFNACSPSPETMKNLAQTIGKVLNRPAFFKVPETMIRLILGEAADPIAGSLRVYPARLSDADFDYKYEDLELALADVL